MKKLLAKYALNILALFVATLWIPGVSANSTSALIWAGLALTLVNLLIRPLVLLITLPVNLLTLGLFTLLTNTWMVMLADAFSQGIEIDGFLAAFLTALLATATYWLFMPRLES